MRFVVTLLLIVATLTPFRAQQDTVDEMLQAARTALRQGQLKEALRLAEQAIERDAKHPRAHLLRGQSLEALARHREAVAAYDQALSLDATLAEAYNQRGSARFKLGDIAGSIADFDKFLELRPRETPGHWMRGISYYYAGRFDDGRKQFEGYQAVDTNDVENAVWHFLCSARLLGVEKARTGLLKIGHDQRVPMMQVYALYAGKMMPADVLAAAKTDAQLFYAHLYLGLYHEVTGARKQALEHLEQAAGKHRLRHYMGDVARVHRDLLRKQLEQKES